MLSYLLVYYFILFTNALHCPFLELSIPPSSRFLSTLFLTQTENEHVWEHQHLLLRLSQTNRKWQLRDVTSELVFESEPGEAPWLVGEWFSVLEDKSVEIHGTCVTDESAILDSRRNLQVQPTSNPSFNSYYCTSMFINSGTELDGWYALQVTLINGQRWWRHVVFSESTLTYFPMAEKWMLISASNLILESETTSDPFPSMRGNWSPIGSDEEVLIEIECSDSPLPTFSPTDPPISCIDDHDAAFAVSQVQGCGDFVARMISLNLDCDFQIRPGQTVRDICCETCASDPPSFLPTHFPSTQPSEDPSHLPSVNPTKHPSISTTLQPTGKPISTCVDDNDAVYDVTAEFRHCSDFVARMLSLNLDCDFPIGPGQRVHDICCASCLPQPSTSQPNTLPPVGCTDNNERMTVATSGSFEDCDAFVAYLYAARQDCGFLTTEGVSRDICCAACESREPVIGSFAPSLLPSLIPTHVPSSIPSNSPIGCIDNHEYARERSGGLWPTCAIFVEELLASGIPGWGCSLANVRKECCQTCLILDHDEAPTTLEPSEFPTMAEEACEFLHVVAEDRFDLWYQKTEDRTEQEKSVWVAENSDSVYCLPYDIWSIEVDGGSMYSAGPYTGALPPTYFDWNLIKSNGEVETISANVLCRARIQDCDSLCFGEEYSPGCTLGSDPKEVDSCYAECRGTQITSGECPPLVGHLEIDYEIEGGSLSRISESRVTSGAIYSETAVVSPTVSGIKVQTQQITKLRDAPSNIRLIIVTSSIYESKPLLRVTFQLMSSINSTAVDSSLSQVMISVYHEDLEDHVECVMDVDAASGVPNTMCDLELDARWFRDTNIVIDVEASLYVGTSIVSMDHGYAQVRARQARFVATGSTEIWGVLTPHPIYARESATLEIYANSATSLNLWIIMLLFNKDLLTITSIEPGSQWRQPTVTGENEISIEFFSSASNSATRESTVGELLLATVTFAIAQGSSGSVLAIYELAAKSLTDWNAVDLETSSVANIIDYTGLVIDASAELMIVEDEYVGVYAIIEDPNVFNTAVLDGERDVILSVTVMGVYFDRYSIITDVECEANNGIFEVTAMTFCILSLSPDSESHGVSMLSVFGIPYQVRAWHPGTRILIQEKRILRSLGCGEFQSSALTAQATWESGSERIGPVIINEYVEFLALDEDIVKVQNDYAVGVSPGISTVWIPTDDINLTFHVDEEYVDAVALHATVLTAINLLPQHQSVSDSQFLDPAVIADLEYRHEFHHEGDQGKIFAYLELSNGEFVDVSLSQSLSAEIEEGFFLHDHVPGYGLTIAVPLDAESSLSRNIRMKWGCNDQTYVTAAPLVNITMANIVSLQLSADGSEITSDTIARDHFGVAGSLLLTLIAEFEDGTQRDLISDSRVELTPSSTTAVEIRDGIVTVTNPDFAGNVDITASFRDLSSSVSIEVVMFITIETLFSPYPILENPPLNANILEIIQCSSHFQRAVVSVIAHLSNGVSGDVSEYCEISSLEETVVAVQRGVLVPVSTGSTMISAQCWEASKTSSLMAMSVRDENQYVSRILDQWPSENRWKYISGEVDSLQPIPVGLLFEDGTVYDDVFNLNWMDLSDQFDYHASTGDLSFHDGMIQLHSNSWDPVTVTISTNCGPEVSLPVTFVTNIQPAAWDVDLQMEGASPRQFSQVSRSDSFALDVSINATPGVLLTFLVRVNFPPELFRVERCEGSGQWGNKEIDFNIDGVPGEIAIAGAGGDESTALEILTIARCWFLVETSESALAEFSGIIDELKMTIDEHVQTVYDTDIIAGRGFIQVNDGGVDDMIHTENSRRRKLQDLCYSSECCELSLHGDVNQDCVVTPYDVEIASYYTADSRKENLPELSSLTEFQRKQMDPNQDWRFESRCSSSNYQPPCPNGGSDLLFLLRYILQKFVWIGELTVTQVGGELILEVEVWKYLDKQSFGMAYDDDTNVWFEIHTELNLQVHADTAVEVSGNYLKVPAMLDATTGKFRASVTGTFAQEDVTITVLTETKNYLGETSLDRRFAFRSSYFWSGIHTPFLSFHIQVPSIVPTDMPTQLPSVSPSYPVTTQPVPPTALPSTSPSSTSPTLFPSNQPSRSPSLYISPSLKPSQLTLDSFFLTLHMTNTEESLLSDEVFASILVDELQAYEVSLLNISPINEKIIAIFGVQTFGVTHDFSVQVAQTNSVWESVQHRVQDSLATDVSINRWCTSHVDCFSFPSSAPTSPPSVSSPSTSPHLSSLSPTISFPSFTPSPLPSFTPSSNPSFGPTAFPSEREYTSSPSNSPDTSTPSNSPFIRSVAPTISQPSLDPSPSNPTALPSPSNPSSSPSETATLDFIIILIVTGTSVQEVSTSEELLVSTMESTLFAEVKVVTISRIDGNIQIILQVISRESLYEINTQFAMDWSTWKDVEATLRQTLLNLELLSSCVGSDCIHTPSLSPSTSAPSISIPTISPSTNSPSAAPTDVPSSSIPSLSPLTQTPSSAPSKTASVDISFRINGVASYQTIERNRQLFIDSVKNAISLKEAWENQIQVQILAINRRRLQSDIAITVKIDMPNQFLDDVTQKASLSSTWEDCERNMKTSSEFADFVISRWCVDDQCTNAVSSTNQPSFSPSIAGAVKALTEDSGSSSSSLILILAVCIALVTCCIVVYVGWMCMKRHHSEEDSVSQKFDFMATGAGDDEWSETVTDTGEVSEIGEDLQEFDMEIEQALQNVPLLCDMKNKIISLIVQLSRMESDGRAELIPQWVKQIEFQQKALHAALTEMFGLERMEAYGDRYDDLWDTARLIATQTSVPKRGVGSATGSALYFEIFDYRCHNNLNRDEFAASARIIWRGISEDDIDILFNLIDSNQEGVFSQEDIQIFMYSSWSGMAMQFREKLNAFIDSHDIEDTLDLLKIQYTSIPRRPGFGEKRFVHAPKTGTRRRDSDLEYFGDNSTPLVVDDDAYFAPGPMAANGDQSETTTITTEDVDTSLGSRDVRTKLGKRRRPFNASVSSSRLRKESYDEEEDVFNDHHSYETFDVPYSEHSLNFSKRSVSKSRDFVNIDTLEKTRDLNKHQFVSIDRLTMPSQKHMSKLERSNLIKESRAKRRQASWDNRLPGLYESPKRRLSHSVAGHSENFGKYRDMGGELDAAEAQKQDPVGRFKTRSKLKEDPTLTSVSRDGFAWDDKISGVGSFFTDNIRAQKRPESSDSWRPAANVGGLSSRLGARKRSHTIQSDV